MVDTFNALAALERLVRLDKKDEVFTEFEISFLEGTARIAGSGKLQEFTDKQLGTLMAIYTQKFILPHIATKNYTTRKGKEQNVEEPL